MSNFYSKMTFSDNNDKPTPTSDCSDLSVNVITFLRLNTFSAAHLSAQKGQQGLQLPPLFRDKYLLSSVCLSGSAATAFAIISTK